MQVKSKMIISAIRKIIPNTLIFSLVLVIFFVLPMSSSAQELPYNDTRENIIIQMSTTGGISSDIMEKTMVPDFTLYGNGRVLFTRTDEKGNYKLFDATVKPEYIIFLLRYFEEEGFFELNENYLNLTVKDLPTTIIAVNLKDKSQTIKIYGFKMAALQRMIPKKLVKIRRKILEFKSDDEKEYKPRKISLFIHEVSRASISKEMKIKKWKVKGIDLRKYASEGKSLIIRYKQSVLTGDNMKNTLNFLRGKTLYENRAGFLRTFYKNHGRYYKVAYRPHLPYER